MSARLDAELNDGRRLVLLSDRGWSAQAGYSWERGHEPSPEEHERLRSRSIWATQSIEDIQETARGVVGPDEPWGDRTYDDAEAQHWGWLAGVLRRNGVDVDAGTLSALPQDIELSDRVLARIGG